MLIPAEGIRINQLNFVDIKRALETELRAGRSFRLRLEPWSEKRTLSQNAMFHAWMGELSRYLILHGRSFCTPAWCKDAMKYTFLGFEETTYTDVTTGAQIVRETLRHTSKLRVGEMFQFMTKVQAWCLDIGCFVRVPVNSEYFALKRQQEE